MKLRAASFLSFEPESVQAGQIAGEQVRQKLGSAPLHLLLVYASINHDQAAVLAGLQAAVGDQVPIIGCSAQGIVSDDQLVEEGFALGVMGFGGTELQAAAAIEREIQQHSEARGRQLAESVKSELGTEPDLVVMLYDPHCAPDVEQMLAGMQSKLNCPIVGAGASHRWGPPAGTYQYFGLEAVSQAAVAAALAGPFAVELGLSHGTLPTGIVMTLTKTSGNRVLEIDGRPALEVWREATGHSAGELLVQDYLASWAIAVEQDYELSGRLGSERRTAHMIRAAVGIDEDSGALIFQAGIAEGTRISFHHRVVDAVLSGTDQMGHDLAQRLQGKTPWAFLGFECGARTVPFLGTEKTVQENAALRAKLGAGVPWLGMMAWGELAPCAHGTRTAFHNYTYPLVALVEREP